MKEKISLAFGAGTFSRPGPRPDRSRGRRRPAPLKSYLAAATGEREPPNMADRTRQTPTRLRHEVTTRNFGVGILDCLLPLRNALPPLRSEWAASHRACGYDSADAPGGGHAPIRCRNATILPR